MKLFIKNEEIEVDYVMLTIHNRPIFFKYVSKKKMKRKIKDMFKVHHLDRLENSLNKKNFKIVCIYHGEYFDVYEIRTLNLYGAAYGHKFGGNSGNIENNESNVYYEDGHYKVKFNDKLIYDYLNEEKGCEKSWEDLD